MKWTTQDRIVKRAEGYTETGTKEATKIGRYFYFVGYHAGANADFIIRSETQQPGSWDFVEALKPETIQASNKRYYSCKF